MTATDLTKKRIVVSTVSQIGSQVLIALLGVITLKLITNYLGVKSYGVYATVLAFVSTFSLLTDLGLNAINGREIAKRPQDAAEIIGQNIGLRMVLCLVMVPVVFGLSFLVYPHANHQLRYGILLLTGFLFFDAIRSVVLGYFTAQVRGHITALVSSLQQLLLTALILAVITADLGFYGLIIAFIVANTISMGAAVGLVNREITIRPRLNIARWRAIIIMSLSLGIIQLINMMYLKIDSIMLSVIKGTTPVGIYGIAYSLIAAFLTLPSFIMTALIPSMATATTQSMTAIIQKAYDYMVILACLLAVGSYLVRHEIILAVTSSNYAAAATPFAVLGLASAFAYINNVFGFASVSLNKHHKIIYVSVVTLVINVLLNLVLIPHYSYNGAAYATLVTEILSLSGTYWIFNRQTRIRPRLVMGLLKPAVAALVTLGTVSLLRIQLHSGNNFIMLAIISLEIVVIYGGTLAVLRGLPEEVEDLVRRLIQQGYKSGRKS